MASSARPDWFVMFFPTPAEQRAIAARLRPLAARLGGEVPPDLHITIGYFVGAAPPEEAITPLRALHGPPPTLHAADLFTLTATPNPQFGYSLFLRIVKDAALLAWRERVSVALAPTGLRPLRSWEEEQPHLLALRNLPAPTADILDQLDDRRWPLTFTAARLVLSQRVGERFQTWYDRPLDDAGPAA